MRVNASVKLILFVLACIGLGHFILSVAQHGAPYTEALLRVTTQQPITLIGGLLAFIYIVFVPLFLLRRRAARAFQHQFATLDSDKLDNDKVLSMRFFTAALDYRVQHGHRAYQSSVSGHFDFFYDYHNHALKWLDEIVSQTQSRSIPRTFILSAIASGHVGRTFVGVHYANGLSGNRLMPNAELLFHDRGDSIEIWSYQSAQALCRLRKNGLKLQPAHRHPNYLSAILSGNTLQDDERQQIELRLMTATQVKGRYQRSEAHAKQVMLELNRWLHAKNETHSRFANDEGIEVRELLGRDSALQTPLNQLLQQLVYRRVDAYYPRARLPLADQSLALDAVILCNGMGLIAITEKHEQGDITYSGDPNWYQFIGENGFELKNPCLQAQQARTALASLLSAHNLTRWPVSSLVVFSKPNVRLNQAIGQTRLQCGVITLDHLESWIDAQPRNPQIQFTQEDIARFDQLMKIPVRNARRESHKSDLQALLNHA